MFLINKDTIIFTKIQKNYYLPISHHTFFKIAYYNVFTNSIKPQKSKIPLY